MSTTVSVPRLLSNHGVAPAGTVSGRTPATFAPHTVTKAEASISARYWIWSGFEDKSLEAKYSLFINKERAVVDLAMTIVKVSSCTIALFQVYPVIGRLAEPLIWNVLGTHLILIPLLWGDIYKEWREVLVLVARLTRMGLIALWWLMDWSYMEGMKTTCQRASLDAGRLTWDALVFPVWLQVGFLSYVQSCSGRFHCLTSNGTARLRIKMQYISK